MWYLLLDDFLDFILVFCFLFLVVLDFGLLDELALLGMGLNDSVFVDEIGVVIVLILAFGARPLLPTLLARRLYLAQ